MVNTTHNKIHRDSHREITGETTKHAVSTQLPLFSIEGEWDWITGGDDDE